MLTTLDGVAITLGLVILYTAVVLYLRKVGRIGPDRALSFYGPAVMMKTQRGRGWLDRVGRFRRFWSVVGDVGVVLAAVAMVAMVALLVFEGIVITQIPASAAPPPQEALGLPGINPIIPVGYGLLALIVGVVLHELAHGILARSQRVGVKSLGILWFIIPVGAFVEQDDEGMNQASRKSRRRIAAAGVLANFVLAFLFFSLLSVCVASSTATNANGVMVEQLFVGGPADNASIAAGDVIISVNGTATPTYSAMTNAMAQTRPNESVAVTYFSVARQQTLTTTVHLGTNPSISGRGYLGIATGLFTPASFRDELIWPPSSPLGGVLGAALWVGLPISLLEPVSGTTIGYYHLVGPLAALGTADFWVLANVLFWLSWMNLLLGLSNALPMYPLDGGLLFRDNLAGALARLRRGWDAARLDAVAGRATIATSVLVVFLILWLLVGAHL